MSQILLLANNDPKKLGHLFCEACATELIIILQKWVVYLNPKYKKDWDLPWHEFHYAKFIYPELIKTFHDKNFVYECPYCTCSNYDTLTYIDNSILDPRLILNSLNTNNYYVCSRCEGGFANGKCVTRIGRDIICTDCLAFI